MHGTATAAATSRLLAHEFAEHGLQVPALRKIMGVAAMRRHDLISRAQQRTNANGNRLLADRQMDRAAHLLLPVAARDLFFDETNAQHLAIEIEMVRMPPLRNKLLGRHRTDIHGCKLVHLAATAS